MPTVEGNLSVAGHQVEQRLPEALVVVEGGMLSQLITQNLIFVIALYARDWRETQTSGSTGKPKPWQYHKPAPRLSVFSFGRGTKRLPAKVDRTAPQRSVTMCG
jgi:hypothetical protein